MELGKHFTENIQQAEEWITRLKRWSDRVETDPVALGIISLLKYIPSNGAQDARRKLEKILSEKPGVEKKISSSQTEESQGESFEIEITPHEGWVKVATRNNHLLEIEVSEENIRLSHGDDDSSIFYPRLREKMSRIFGIKWENDEAELKTARAVRELFKSELDRAYSTINWAIEEHNNLAE